MSNTPNGYTLSRKWFDFCFENPEKIKPRHTALYFFAVEHCNRLGWKKKFGFPTTMAKEAIGIGSYNTYKKTLDDLVEWGFIEMIQKSQNQYSSNIIALSNFDKSLDKSLDKALTNHSTKQCESSSSINKQTNQQTNKPTNKKSVSTNGTDFPSTCEYLDEAKELSQYLLDSITEYDPSHKYANNPPSTDRWVLDIERAMRLDGRTKEQLEFIIDYIYKANGKHSDFWAGNVESGKKLRKHFDKIKSQIRQESQNGRSKQNKDANIAREAQKLV